MILFSPTETTIGRFAPSPTGSLHFGSLIAAIASYLSVRHQQGKWLLRIEDVDIHRKQKGASSAIIHALESYGFEWDGDIVFQSQRTSAYEEALAAISDKTYPCSCTRKELQAAALTGKFSYIYPGFCREKLKNKTANQLSIRVKTNTDQICFDDRCQPEKFCQNIKKEIGDFVLKRSDGLFAYQLAVVVDDAWQGITEVVRGADLFDNTPRQIYLQNLLGFSHPDYLHFPVAIDHSGKKLSKQNLSPEISLASKRLNLINALDFLGQQPPALAEFSSLDNVWLWAIKHWNADRIPKKLSKRIEYE